jgi:hypothetical protein
MIVIQDWLAEQVLTAAKRATPAGDPGPPFCTASTNSTDDTSLDTSRGGAHTAFLTTTTFRSMH